MKNVASEPTKKATVVCFGEVVWDLFPDGPRLGGAPANVAYHSVVLGQHGTLASRVGQDPLGEQTLEILGHAGIDVSLLTQARQLAQPTGTVQVAFHNNDPVFTIDPEGAWTRPDWNDAWAQAYRTADVAYFGTLMLAWQPGRTVLEHLAHTVSPACWRVADLNLRPPYDTDEAIHLVIKHANALKMSEEEAARLATLFGVTDVAHWLVHDRGYRAVAITRGHRGSVLVTPEGRHDHLGVKIDTSQGDAVGAGDAFTSVLIHHWLRGSSLEQTNHAANGYAAFVASKRGSVPEIPATIRQAAQGQR